MFEFTLASIRSMVLTCCIRLSSLKCLNILRLYINAKPFCYSFRSFLHHHQQNPKLQIKPCTGSIDRTPGTRLENDTVCLENVEFIGCMLWANGSKIEEKIQ